MQGVHVGSHAQHLAAEDVDPIHPPGWKLTSAPSILHPNGEPLKTRKSNTSTIAADSAQRLPAFLCADTPLDYLNGPPVPDGGNLPERRVTPTRELRTMPSDDGRASFRLRSYETDNIPIDGNMGDLASQRKGLQPAPLESMTVNKWEKQGGTDSVLTHS